VPSGPLLSSRAMPNTPADGAGRDLEGRRSNDHLPLRRLPRARHVEDAHDGAAAQWMAGQWGAGARLWL